MKKRKMDIQGENKDMTVEEAFFLIYDEKLERKEQQIQIKSGDGGNSEVAPVQPQKEKRKESKVTKSKPVKNPEAAAMEQEEEQLPGQMSVADYDGVVLGVVPEVTYEEIAEENSEQSKENIEMTGQEENIKDIWEEIKSDIAEVKMFTAAWAGREKNKIPGRALKDAYHNALGLAAGFEKLLNRGRSNE